MQERWLEWLRGAPAGSVILPCEDEGLELIAKNREMLLELGPGAVRGGRRGAARDARQVTRPTRWRGELGIESPLTFNVHTQDDIAVALERISYPCALKPVHSHAFARHFAGMKAFRVHNDDDMRAALARTVALGIEMIATEIIPGRDDQFFSYYSYIDEEGEPLLHVTKRKLRQHPIWFGSGCFHATDRNPEAAELGLRFFEGVGLRGLGNVEFKRDARDGRLKLIECNHRFTAATGLLRAAGLDLPLFVYNRLTGRPLPPVDGYRPGMTMWYPMRDLRAFAAYRRQRRDLGCCRGCAASCAATTIRSRACRTAPRAGEQPARVRPHPAAPAPPAGRAASCRARNVDAAARRSRLHHKKGRPCGRPFEAIRLFGPYESRSSTPRSASRLTAACTCSALTPSCRQAARRRPARTGR